MTKDQSLEFMKSALGRVAPTLDVPWENLIRHLEPVNVTAKSVLIYPNEPVDRIYFVVRGLIKCYYIESSGKEVTKDFVVEGGLAAPYASLLLKKPSNMAMMALEDSQLLAMRAPLLQGLYDSHPNWQTLGRLTAEALYLERAHREYQMMVLDAEQRYDAFLKDFPQLLNRVTQYEIASYLGITPVGLSKIRARKARGGVTARSARAAAAGEELRKLSAV